jgi:hypothetical protein
MHAQRADRQRKWACADSRHPRATRCVAWLAALVLVARIVLAEPISRESATTTRTEHKIVVELTRKDTFVTLADTANIADACVTLVRVDGLPFRYRLVPASGIVCTGQSVDIVLDKFPDVRIRLSMVTRGKERAVKVSPLIGLERGVPVDFTLERVQRTVWSLQRRVKELQRQVSASRKEYQLIDTWLATPGNKPLDLVKAAHLRQKILQQEVLASQRELPFVQKRFTALRKTAELARQIHGVTVIRFTVGPPVRREQ